MPPVLGLMRKRDKKWRIEQGNLRRRYSDVV